MRNFSAWIGTFLILPAFLFAGCNTSKPTAPTPPPYEAENPVLAIVGDFPIDKQYFEASLHLLPHGLYERYSQPSRYREFLDELVVQEVFYQEGLRQKQQNDTDYVNLVSKAKRIALVEYALEKAVQKNDPITEEQIRATYDANPEEATLVKGNIPSFSEARPIIHRQLLKERMEGQLRILRPKLEERFSVRYYLDRLKIGNENSNKPVVESGIVTWTPMDFAQKAVEAGLREQLKDYGGRVEALKRIVAELLIHDNAVADQIDREPEFQTRVKVIKHFLLSNHTQTLIIGNDVKVTLNEARAYYDLNPDEFLDETGAPVAFSSVQEKVLEKATEAKREKVLKELAKALSRDRFKGVVFQEHCDRLWGNSSEG